MGFWELGRFSNWSLGTCNSPWLAARGQSFNLEDISIEKGLFNVRGWGFSVLVILWNKTGQRKSRGAFYSNGPCGKLNPRTDIFSKSKRKTGSGTKGGPVWHRYKLEKAGAGWKWQLFSSSFPPSQLSFTSPAAERAAIHRGVWVFRYPECNISITSGHQNCRLPLHCVFLYRIRL